MNLLNKVLLGVKRFFTPMEDFSPKVMRNYRIALTITFLAIWTFIKVPFVPKLGEVLTSFGTLWKSRGLFFELWTSLKLNFYALGLGSVIAFGLAYLSTIPAIRPIVRALTKVRFLGFTGLVFIFMLYIGTGMKLKLSLMIFAVAWFYLTALFYVVNSIKSDRYDYAYTLRMNRWQTLYEIVIREKLHEALGTMLQFAGYGWAMLTAVEGLSRSKGGIGVMILNSDKYLQISEIFALVLTILVVGIILDFFLGWLIKLACPYAFLQIRGGE